MQNLPEETVYQNITEGLSIIKNQRAVLHVQYGTFLGFFRENPTFNQNIKVFGKGRAEYSSLIVNRNSPLKPILQKGIVFEISSKKREFICFAENIFHRKIFSIVFDGKYFPPFLMENIFHRFSVGNSQ